MSLNQSRIQASSAGATYSKSKCHALSNGPSDSISHIAWSNHPTADKLSVSSWDKSIRIWQIRTEFGGSLVSQPLVAFQLQAPALASCFSPDNTKVFAGGCDNMVQLFDLASGNSQGQQVAQHDRPIFAVLWSSVTNTLITAGWDGFLKMWDGRSATPVWHHQSQSKIISLDIQNQILAYVNMDKSMQIFNLQNMSTQQTPLTPIKSTPRSMALFPDCDKVMGAAFSTFDGRVHIVHLQESNKNYSFKCHRIESGSTCLLYCVNGVNFHPKLGCLVTCGSDGTIAIWDKESRFRILGFEKMSTSIVSAQFNPSGNHILAFAESYDWHKGFDRQEISKSSNTVYLYAFNETDFKRQNRFGGKR